MTHPRLDSIAANWRLYLWRGAPQPWRRTKRPPPFRRQCHQRRLLPEHNREMPIAACSELQNPEACSPSHRYRATILST